MLQLIATMPEYTSYFKQLREKYITPENHESVKVLSSIISTISRINRVCPGFSFFYKHPSDKKHLANLAFYTVASKN